MGIVVADHLVSSSRQRRPPASLRVRGAFAMGDEHGWPARQGLAVNIGRPETLVAIRLVLLPEGVGPRQPQRLVELPAPAATLMRRPVATPGLLRRCPRHVRPVLGRDSDIGRCRTARLLIARPGRRDRQGGRRGQRRGGRGGGLRGRRDGRPRSARPGSRAGSRGSGTGAG